MNLTENEIIDLRRSRAEIQELQRLVRELQRQGKWTAFTFTPTATSGAFTTVSGSGQFARVGDIMHVTATITITTNGTAAGGIVITLPAAATGYAVGNGRENTATGNLLQVFVSGGNSVAVVLTYHNQYPGGDGRTIYLSFEYPVA